MSIKYRSTVSAIRVTKDNRKDLIEFCGLCACVQDTDLRFLSTFGQLEFPLSSSDKDLGSCYSPYELGDVLVRSSINANTYLTVIPQKTFDRLYVAVEES